MAVVLVVGAEQFIPPGEGGAVITHKVHVVKVVEARAGVERDHVQRVQRDIIATGQKTYTYVSYI